MLLGIKRIHRMYSSISLHSFKGTLLLISEATNYKLVAYPHFDCPFSPFCPTVVKENPLKVQSSITAFGGFLYRKQSFIVYILITITIVPSPVFSAHGRSKSGRTSRRWTEMFGKSPAFRKNRSSDGGK